MYEGIIEGEYFIEDLKDNVHVAEADFDEALQRKKM